MLRTIDICITPEEMAEEYWRMNHVDQAEFFNHLADISGGNMHLQLHWVATSSHLTPGGKDLMKLIGEYATE